MCVSPVMEWPFVKGVSLHMAQGAERDSSIPTTLHKVGQAVWKMDGWYTFGLKN